MAYLTARHAAAALALLSLPATAPAELGGAMGSVQVDRGKLGARMTSHPLGGYARHDLTRANGGSVRELTNAEGKVFAVTWSGPGKPDLRTLLGPYFAAMQAGGAGGGQTMHALRRPLRVSRPDLQIQTAGHLGWFRGVALIPSLAPPGFDPATLAVAP
jgi:hypothetical protein